MLAKIEELKEDEKWCYSACCCHKGVTLEDGMIYCVSCGTYVFEVIPRLTFFMLHIYNLIIISIYVLNYA